MNHGISSTAWPRLKADELHASCAVMLQKAIKVGAYDVVVDALRRNHELGLGKLSVTRYAIYLQQLAHAGQLKAMLE